MYINTSVNSLSINNLQRLNNNSIKTHLERLSSGLRINRGADDPSGLAISRGMRAQIRGLNVATQNLQDGISLLRTQDGALAESHDMLMRMRDLTIRGANEATLTQEDRNRIEIELRALSLEITRKAEATTFNGKQILIGDDVAGGYKIAFWSNRDGAGDIYVMNADGSEQIRLTDQGASFNRSEISPDGSKILFSTDRDGNREIYIMDSDGENESNVTNNASFDAFPTWSPDGSQIAFTTGRDGNSEIYVMNSDGTGLVNITNDAASDMRPNWSPDGSKILFNSDRDGNRELYTINADGTNLTRITVTAANEANAFWSPDGSKILFDRPGIGVLVMNADGSNETFISTGLSNGWDKSGDRVLYQIPAGPYEVYSNNLSGTDQVNLTQAPGSREFEGWFGSPGPDDQVLQIGPDAVASHRLTIAFRDMRAEAIGVSGVSVLRQKAAQVGIELVDHAIETVSNFRSEIGQEQRRLNKIAGDLATAHVNVSASNSRIEDADMARELTEQTSALIKDQSTTAMATHSNNLLQGARQLIGVVENAERIM